MSSKTSLAIPDEIRQTAPWIRACDWFSPSPHFPEERPPELQAFVSFALTNPLPICIFWGSALIRIYNDPFLPFLTSGEWDSKEASLQSVLTTGRPLQLTNGPDDTPVVYSLSPLPAGGSVAGVVLTVTESGVPDLVTKRFQALVETQCDALVLSNEEGVILYASRSSGHLLGYPTDQLAGTRLSDRMHPDDVAAPQQAMQHLRQMPNASHTSIFRVRQPDNSWRLIECLATNCLADPDIQAIVCRYSDPVKRLRAEDAARESEERFDKLAEVSPADTLYIDQEKRYRFVNRGYAKRVHRTREELLGKKLKDVVDGEFYSGIEQYLEAGLAGRELFVKLNLNYPDIGWHTLSVAIVPDFDQSGQVKGALIAIHDITDRKRLQENLGRANREKDELIALLEAIFRTAPAGIAYLDADLRFVQINDKLASIDGLPREHYLGHRLADVGPEHAKWDPLFRQVLETGEPVLNLEVSGDSLPEPWKGRHWLTSLYPVRISSGEILGVGIVVLEITARMQAEQALLTSLEEKKALLKEVHHRVKNNLQVIISLLDLQSAQIDSGKTLSLFEETRNRIHSIAAIHEQLYGSTSLAAIDFTEYARCLSNDLARFYDMQERIQIEVSGSPLKLSLERAVPLGLLLNEVLSNAFKHAFPDCQTGSVRISTQSDGEKSLVLKVADTGVGMPSGLDFQHSPSLGLRLIYLLARQLQGTVQVDTEAGTEITLRLLYDASTPM